MNLAEIEEMNRVSLAMTAAVRRGAIAPSFDIPFYGYLDVTDYDCPPFVLFTNNDSPVVRWVLIGDFEPTSVDLWCALARGASGILDIGANVGLYSVCAAKLRTDIVVHAFEPNPYAFARLRMHKHVNALPNLCEYAVGVGPRDQYKELSWIVKPGGNIASGAGFGGHEGQTEGAMAKVIALDGSGIVETLGDRPLVKIDVEGAEVVVLEGARTLLSLRPDMLIETLSQKKCDQLNALLTPLGYTFYGINETSRTLEARPQLVCPDINSHNLNQFVTIRPRAELEGMSMKGIRIVSA